MNYTGTRFLRYSSACRYLRLISKLTERKEPEEDIRAKNFSEIPGASQIEGRVGGINRSLILPLLTELNSGVVGEDEPEEMEDQERVQNHSKHHPQHISHELKVKE